MELGVNDFVLVKPDPMTRINDRWLLHDKDLQRIVADFSEDTEYKNFQDPYWQDMENQHAELGQQAFLHVVSETVYHYPVAYLSEKPIKPIACKRPFVVLGPAGSLASLHHMGFQTFHEFWDESYDTILDPEQRLLAVIDVISSVTSLSMPELQNLCVAMSDVLNYNFYFYTREFQARECERLETKCRENLKPRYDTDQKSHS